MTKDSTNLPSDEIQSALKDICQHFDKEDRSVRERQVREYRRNKFYWDGFTNIFWSQTNHDWRIIDTQLDADTQDVGYYDKRVNIYQAYLESIIAALSASIPGLKAYPDDAENPMDITTAKACDKIYELLKRHNNGDLLWLHSLFILSTEGMVAAKICKDTDKKYGVHKTANYEDYQSSSFVCPHCGNVLEDSLLSQIPVSPQAPVLNDFGEETPSDPNQLDPSQLGLGAEFDQEGLNQEIGQQDQGQIYCPECDGEIDPQLEKTIITLSRISGHSEEPKSKIGIEAYGGLFVKVPIYARTQEEMLYLRYSYESHYANIRKKFPHLREKFNDGYNSTGYGEPYEKWGRLSTQYLGEYPTNTLTCSYYWLRPEAFHVLNNEEMSEELEKEYPNGCCVTLIEDCFGEVTAEELDKTWKITKNPLSDYVTFQPIGTKMIDVQDISNELISLTLQTIEHGIPQTFVDPKVLNLKAYGQTSVAPGMIYPAIPSAGRSLGEGFHEVKTATLSQEVLPFGQSIQSLGQLSVGALPSLFGGADLSGSKTASQYAMSKNQAMQRLQNSWKMMSILWKDIFSIAIPAYIECVVEDEKFVKKDSNGNFVNVFIKKAELEGEIGQIELEGAENLPSTWQQKKDTIMQFLQAANPIVMQALIDPVNLPVLAESVGLGDLELPGMDDRTKQYEEIGVLITSAPMMMPGVPPDQMMSQDPSMMSQDPMMQGQMQGLEISSVSIEPEVDNDEIHIAICRSWLVGESGRLAKVENPDGYRNVLLHMKEHVMNMQMQLQMQMPLDQAGNEQTEGSAQNDKMAAPLKNGNVNG